MFLQASGESIIRKSASAKFVKSTPNSRKRRIFDAFEMEGAERPRPGRLRLSPASVAA
jgi:hypothetical protein